MYPLFLGKLGMTEILLILLFLVIFFGGKKIPELMRGMGRGVREFKDAIENKPGADAPAAPQDGAKTAAQDGAKPAADAAEKPEEKK